MAAAVARVRMEVQRILRGQLKTFGGEKESRQVNKIKARMAWSATSGSDSGGIIRTSQYLVCGELEEERKSWETYRGEGGL